MLCLFQTADGKEETPSSHTLVSRVASAHNEASGAAPQLADDKSLASDLHLFLTYISIKTVESMVEIGL